MPAAPPPDSVVKALYLAYEGATITSGTITPWESLTDQEKTRTRDAARDYVATLTVP